MCVCVCVCERVRENNMYKKYRNLYFAFYTVKTITVDLSWS